MNTRPIGLVKSPHTGYVDILQIQNTQQHIAKMIAILPWKEFKNSGRMVCSLGKDYPYSGQIAKAVDWSVYPQLKNLMDKANELLGTDYNSVLINWYPKGTRCGIYQHSDNEKELVSNSTVLSISLGASCEFWFHDTDPKNKYPFPKTKSALLQDGTVFLMDTACQKHYTHSIDYGVMVDHRISLTFRTFK